MELGKFGSVSSIQILRGCRIVAAVNMLSRPRTRMHEFLIHHTPCIYDESMEKKERHACLVPSHSSWIPREINERVNSSSVNVLNA